MNPSTFEIVIFSIAFIAILGGFINEFIYINGVRCRAKEYLNEKT